MASRLCYALGIGLNVAGIATVLGLNWEGFISFSGFGYYSLFLYLGFLAVGALAWGAGLLLRRERWLDLMFWAACCDDVSIVCDLSPEVLCGLKSAGRVGQPG